MTSMTRWKHATAFFKPNGFRLNWYSRPFASNAEISFLRVAMALGGRRIEDLSWSTTYNLPHSYNNLHAWKRIIVQVSEFVYGLAVVQT